MYDHFFHSGSILILFFSGISGTSFITNHIDHIPVEFRDDKGYIQIDKTLSKQELLDDYVLINQDSNTLTTYKMYC